MIVSIFFVAVNLASFYFISFHYPWLSWCIFLLTILFWLFVLSFFRVPKRKLVTGDQLVISPADGKVVVIEETVDEEYFKGKRLQISIFMSPANVHQNRNPVSGEVVYNQYHKGKYLVAWHPKSSTENEQVFHRERKTYRGDPECPCRSAGEADRRRCCAEDRQLPEAGAAGGSIRRNGIHKIRKPGRPVAARRHKGRGRAKPGGAGRGNGVGEVLENLLQLRQGVDDIGRPDIAVDIFMIHEYLVHDSRIPGLSPH